MHHLRNRPDSGEAARLQAQAQQLAPDTVIPIPTWDEVTEAYAVRESDTHIFHIARLGFDWRLLATPKASPLTWDYGWAYVSGEVALAACVLWNDVSEAEPAQWTRRVGMLVRQIPA